MSKAALRQERTHDTCKVCPMCTKEIDWSFPPMCEENMKFFKQLTVTMSNGEILYFCSERCKHESRCHCCKKIFDPTLSEDSFNKEIDYCEVCNETTCTNCTVKENEYHEYLCVTCATRI